MQKNTMLTTDIFATALLEGNLDYFIDVINDPAVTFKDMELKAPYDNVIKNQLISLGRRTYLFSRYPCSIYANFWQGN